tara:strand:- start:877 stop:1188 length:312 start_codon:yes stop_codon:yes gene_type:complete
MKTEHGRAAQVIFEGLNGLGFVDKKTVREFYKQDSQHIEILTAEEIQTIRSRENISQGYLAKMLNVSLGQVRKLESGEREPKGALLTLLNLIKQHGLEYIKVA